MADVAGFGVGCPASTLGCTWTGTREDLDKHVDGCWFKVRDAPFLPGRRALLKRTLLHPTVQEGREFLESIKAQSERCDRPCLSWPAPRPPSIGSQQQFDGVERPERHSGPRQSSTRWRRGCTAWRGRKRRWSTVARAASRHGAPLIWLCAHWAVEGKLRLGGDVFKASVFGCRQTPGADRADAATLEPASTQHPTAPKKNV